MNNKILAGMVVLAFICIISIAYACVSLDIDAEYEEYVGVGDRVYIYAWVNSGGPVIEWDWDWPSAFTDIHQDTDDPDDSTWDGVCYTGGFYEVEVYADSEYDWDYDYTRVYVVDVNVYPVQSYFVGLNDDDDNDNGTPDKDESGPVLGEDDLAEVWVYFAPSELNTGKVLLSASNNIKVWYDSQKEVEVSLPATWYVSRDQVPSTIWVEGVSASSSIGDTNLKIEYKTYWSPILDDGSVDLTVIDVDINQPTGADHDYQFSFDSADPGVCEFQVSGTTGFTTLNADLKWTLEEIADPCTTLTAVPDPCVGTSVTFTYTGLPTTNSEFGEKTLTLEYSNTGIKDSIDLEIFFDPNKTNNPGNDPENQDGVSTYPVPNWFYYWKEGRVVPDLFQDANGFYYGGPSDELSGEYFPDDNTLWLYSYAFWPPGDYNDVNIPLYNHHYHTSINSGLDGLVDTPAFGDDYAILVTRERNVIAITAGSNEVIDTVKDGDDKIVDDAEYVKVLNTGNDGILDSDAQIPEDAWMWYTYDSNQYHIQLGGAKPFQTVVSWDDGNPNTTENDFLDTLPWPGDEFDLTGVDPNIFFLSKDSVGIDFVDVVCKHELMHQTLFDMVFTGGGGNPPSDPYIYDRTSDHDYVDNQYELDDDLGYKLCPSKKDTYNMFEDFYESKTKWANLSFDNEFLCFMTQGQGSGDSSKDWSKGGKQWFRD